MLLALTLYKACNFFIAQGGCCNFVIDIFIKKVVIVIFDVIITVRIRDYIYIIIIIIDYRNRFEFLLIIWSS